MDGYAIPDTLKSRLADVASKHNLGTADTLEQQLIAEGLKHYGVAEGTVASQLTRLVDEQGYSSVDEAVEHLLLRGLHEYEHDAATREEAEARVSGIGHID